MLGPSFSMVSMVGFTRCSGSCGCAAVLVGLSSSSLSGLDFAAMLLPIEQAVSLGLVHLGLGTTLSLLSGAILDLGVVGA